METPIYPPAVAFEQPVALPYPLSLSTVSIAELMRNPAAWAAVVAQFPAIKFMTAAPQAKPNLGNMTVIDFARFAGMADSPKLQAADEALRRLLSKGEALP